MHALPLLLVDKIRWWRSDFVAGGFVRHGGMGIPSPGGHKVSLLAAALQFSFIALGIHLGLMLGVGKMLGFTRREILLASNANIGGA